MRICFVSREVAGVRGGGIGTYVSEAGKALTARGHEVWLVTEDPGVDALPGFARVVAVTADPSREAPFLFGAPHYEHAYTVHETLQRCGVPFDAIEFADYQAEGLIAVREQRWFRTYGDAVLSVMLHTPAYECYQFNGQLHRADRVEREVFALEVAMLREAEALTAPSIGVRDAVTRRIGRDPDDVEIIRYPMALDPHERPTANAGRLEDLEFVYFGRIEPRKGVENLIEAFARLPELRLRLIGADTPFSPYGRSLRDWLARRAPANVEFVDALPRDELLESLRSAAVCILPSLFENWPNACIEAMALGRVVVGGRHGGMSEMIEDGVSGFTVDGRDSADIVRVLRDGVGGALGRLEAIGAAAARRIRELSAPETSCAAVERAIERRRPRAARSGWRTPSVSIVIPFYRDRDTIHAAVDSAISQEHASTEILIVNDGSPLDDAPTILAGIAARDDRIRVLDKPNGGLSSARNHGIEHARGEYLLFLDADNALRPGYARDAVTALERDQDAGFAVPHVHMFDDDTGATVGIYNPLPFSRELSLLINNFGDAGACFRRAVFERHDLRYDELLISFEDWALWIDLDRAGVRGVAIPRILYDYRKRTDSMMAADAWPNFRALIGLLIERHHAPEPATERMLQALNQTWGRDADEWARAREERGRWPLRYWLVDKAYGLTKRVPGVGGVLDRVGDRLRPGRRRR